MKTTPANNARRQRLTVREIRGLVHIAALRPDVITYQDSTAMILNCLLTAIDHGNPSFFIKDCSRKTAANWAR